MKKRLLAMLMVLMLVVSLLPVGALAAGDGEYDIVRLMDRSEWSEAVHARAGVEVGSAVSIQRIFVYDANHNQMNTGAASGLLTPDCYYADTYDVSEEDIQTIVVILTSDGKTISAVFDTEDFEVTDTGGVAATKHIQLTLTERGKGRPSGHQVNFYAELNNETTYSLYDTIYVQDGQQIGDQMPNDPPVGSYVFLGWQTEEDGGISVDRNTYVYSDMNVYAAKGTSGTGHAQEYHVMGSTDKRSNALAIEVADHYNSANNTDYGVESFTIEDISVNGTASNTNPIYAENEWKDEGSYYYVYNVSRDPVEVIPENHNDRVEVADITGITVYGKLNGSDYSQFIPVSELSITEVQNNVVVELRVREKLDGVTKELVTTSDVSAPSVEGVTIPDIGETVAVPENGSVTLMYKISVFGDAGAAYNVTDENATVVNGDSLQGTIDSSRVAVIYVTKTFTADDITNGCLTNNATVVPGDNSTLGTDDGDNDAEAIVDAEVDDDPQPEEPRNPTEDDLSKLAVVLECINEDVPHTEDPKTFNLETAICTYDIEQSGEQYICFVMPDYDKILDTYNEQVAGGHTYADEVGKAFTLVWTGEAWDNGDAEPITCQVKCETPEQPTMYKIHVTVHNGTATFCGSEVTSHILAAENEDITITFTPDEGYTLDYATIDGDMLQIPDDGVYTLKLVGSDHTIEVFYAEDKLGGGDDGTEPDGTPDYRQVFVKYVAADENGVVTPTFDTFNLEVDEIGKVMTDDALSLSGMATPNADATFAYWTIEGLGYDGGAYSYEADLSGKGFTGYVAGETYTFTAYFNGPVVKPEQPDVYNIYVTVHNGTATFYGSEVTSHILAAENEDITITFTPNEGYTLDYATIDGNMLLIPDGGVYTLKQVDKDHTIEVFYESDKIGTEDPSEGDGVPDKYQATVNLVAGENGEVTGEMTKVYTIFDADGNYAEEGVITPSLEGVTVTPDEGYKVDGWTNAAGERVNPESEITVEGGDVVVFTVNFQSDPSLKVITSFEKKLVTDRKTYHSFGLRVPTFIRNGSTVVVDEGKCVTLLYAISLTGTPGAEYAITDTGADVAGGNALTGEIPETGVVTVYVTKDFTWREAAAAAYKDDALVNTAAVELTDNPNEPGQESTEEVDVVIDWDDPNVPVVPSDPDDEDEDDEVFVPKWLNTEDHFAYIVGYEDGTIKPENNITRAEVATIFFRLLTDDARARFWSSENDYTDVATDSWYNNAVSTLSNMGIINGYEDGTFQPNASITRAEFTAIATRFFDYTAEYDGAFNDVASGSWYADYVQAAVDMGLVDGYPDGGFHPNSYITRAEAVTIVNRVLNRVPHEDYLLSTRVMNTWPDNVYGAWYYADMQEATNSHDYDWIRVSGERVEEWTEKLTERDWAALEQQWSTAYSG